MYCVILRHMMRVKRYSQVLRPILQDLWFEFDAGKPSIVLNFTRDEAKVEKMDSKVVCSMLQELCCESEEAVYQGYS